MQTAWCTPIAPVKAYLVKIANKSYVVLILLSIESWLFDRDPYNGLL